MIKTLIFDFDGTIADCKKLHQDGFRHAVLTVCPEAQFTDEEVEGRPTREKIRILHAKGFQFNGDKLNEIKQAHTQAHLEDYITYNPELHKEFERLATKYNVCLATNATEVFIHRSLDIMKIKDCFVRINTATDFPAKPDTTTFVDCFEFTFAEPNESVIFEDSPVGIQCAKNTGANVVEVLDVNNTIERMKEF